VGLGVTRRPPAILTLGPRVVIEATSENLARVARELLAPIKVPKKEPPCSTPTG
jgi:hypothetical protein